LALASLAGLALAAGVRAVTRPGRPIRLIALLSGFVGVLIAHMFAVFTVVNALLFYLGASLLATGRDSKPGVEHNRVFRRQANWIAVGCSAVVAMGLVWDASRMVEADLALGNARRLIEAGDRTRAVNAYQHASRLRSTGVTADLYFSRVWAQISADAPDALTKVYFSQLAASSALLSAESAEQRQNAWYNLAMLAAARGDAETVETGLRQAISNSPNWFKPHWALARLLYAEERWADAATEARLAAELDGGKDAEVAASVAEILRSASHFP